MRLLLLLMTGCSAKAPPPEQSGAQVFQMACARCHGPRGAGDGPLGQKLGVADLRTSTLDHAGTRALVMLGRGSMPPHEGRLSPAQIDTVSEYASTLR